MIMVKALEQRTADQGVEINALKESNKKLTAQLAAADKMKEEWAVLMDLLEHNEATKDLYGKMGAILEAKQNTVAGK
jgi:uncharacterized coiled-coil protein SlyX